MIISQGSTIQHQLAGLKEKEEAIGTFEDRMHQVVTMVIMIMVVIFTGGGDIWNALASQTKWLGGSWFQFLERFSLPCPGVPLSPLTHSQPFGTCFILMMIFEDLDGGN